MEFTPKNVLLIHFGQIGDVILGLPALHAFRERFQDSRITLLVGEQARAVVELANCSDEIIAIDRYELRESNKIWSIGQVFKIVAELRRRHFDFVVDLHSLYESNLLGYFSGAPKRLFANRDRRSLDFLSNFRPRPPREDRSLHLTDHYFRALQPLGITPGNTREALLNPKNEDVEAFRSSLHEHGLEERELVGINLGSGHPSRDWGVENFARLAHLVERESDAKVIAFSGPEEAGVEAAVDQYFPDGSVLFNKLDLQELAGAFKCLEVLVGNDTGPMHLGAVVGTPVAIVMGKDSPTSFIPRVKAMELVMSGELHEMDEHAVIEPVVKLYTAKQAGEFD